jgi:NDP-sugar pyrophosphorylase family protein
MIAWVIERLAALGIRHIVVNAHHFGEQLRTFVAEYRCNFGVKLYLSDESAQLLDTGGALVAARELLQDLAQRYAAKNLLVHNADVYTDFDLHRLVQAHEQTQNAATLLCQRRHSSRRQLLFADNQLCGRIPAPANQPLLDQAEPLAFCGVQLIRLNEWAHLPQEQYPFSIIDWYLQRAAAGAKIAPLPLDSDSHWFDLGKAESLRAAAEIVDGKLREG